MGGGGGGSEAYLGLAMYMPGVGGTISFIFGVVLNKITMFGNTDYHLWLHQTFKDINIVEAPFENFWTLMSVLYDDILMDHHTKITARNTKVLKFMR